MNTVDDNKVVVTVAVTGAMGDKFRHPILPVTPREIAESALEAHSAGAAVAHIHVRDPETSEPSMDFELYREVVERIRDASTMLINLTTSAGARIVANEADLIGLGPESTWSSPEKRTAHVMKLKPDLCTLDVGSMNFGSRLFANIVSHVEKMASLIKGAGVKPELEVFDLGHIQIANALIEKGLVESPPLIQICLGIQWGSPANFKTMLLMKESLPHDALWGGFAIGSNSLLMVAQAALLGGNVRVGFEDNFFLSRGVPAKTNAQLVEKAVQILKALDKEPASVQDAHQLLALK